MTTVSGRAEGADPSVVVRYFAAARAAAGVATERVAAATVEDLVRTICEAHGARMTSVMAVASLLLDGRVAHEPTGSLLGVACVDVLPPFAGG
ncbi:MoaD/ThiS family protein [Nocardioides panacis]|uniref:MoaD/ThiS family protein n=1 Tax=Nocardioides panacis TaxID=2849501 RepID=A0A975SWV0_9ACTN|nr:MoaD/ThiS family protein [Nocardioides panacis]QWZ07405.1 MoaD/ThiS family protein [Nocardioides panacis]